MSTCNSSHVKPWHWQKGFMLPLAIFLMVVLASLGVYAARLSVMSNASSVQDILSARAYLSARAGAEWAAMKVLSPGSTTTQVCPAYPAGQKINGFDIAIACDWGSEYTEQGNERTVRVYEISATATQGAANGSDFISRVISMTVARCLYTDPVTSVVTDCS